MTDSITVDVMRNKLLTLDTVREALAATEPLAAHSFRLGDRVRWEVDPGWFAGTGSQAGTAPVGARVLLGEAGDTREYVLSREALLEATSVIGLNKTYSARCPGDLLEPQLNYWWNHGMPERRGGAREYQLLTVGDTVAAVTRATINPFSNLRLLDEAIDGVVRRYGPTEVLADYKFHHDLRRTHLRLIVPGHRRQITGTGERDDPWSVGIQIKNSLTGEEMTSIEGYLFRWWCTNGAIDTRNSTGPWTRRGNHHADDVYEWARATVDEVLGGLEPALDAVQSLVDIPVEGQANDVLRDVFNFYRVPVPDRARIIENMVDSGGPLTMYSVVAAITEVANRDNIDPGNIDRLLRMGGDLAAHAAERCDSCNRLMPH